MRCSLIITTIINLSFILLYDNAITQISEKNIGSIYRNKEDKSWGNKFFSLFSKNEFGKSYAIIIGIGDYKKDWPKLEAPYYDAKRIRDYLIQEAEFDFVITLTNAKATKKIIDKAMEEVFPKVLKENDRFLFYFSGHGTQRMVGDFPKGYLVLQNCGTKSYSDMISMEEIENWDNLIYRTKHVLFILDCCFSGLAGTQYKSKLKAKSLTRLSKYAHHLITAGTGNEISLADLNKWQGSLFTDSFLKAVSGRADLNSKDYKPDGVVSLKELMEYIGHRIDEESVKVKATNPLSKGIKMSPQMRDLKNSDGEFFFITKSMTDENIIERQYDETDINILFEEKKGKQICKKCWWIAGGTATLGVAALAVWYFFFRKGSIVIDVPNNFE